MSAPWRAGRFGIAAAIITTFLILRYLFTHSDPWSLTASNGLHKALPPELATPHGSDQTTPSQESSPQTDHAGGSSTAAPAPSKLETIHTPPNPPAHMSCGVTKVSMLYGSHKFSQLEGALESHRHHSDRWGCGFESLDFDLTTRKLYSKHYFLLSVMLRELAKPVEDRKKWLMWVDADSILLNPALSPEVFLPPDHLENVFALVTADHNGLNNGVFYLRIHPSSLDLLTQTVAYPLAHPDEDLGWFGEQAAMANVINATETAHGDKPGQSGIVWVPRKWFNTYQMDSGFEGEPGHFMVHFAGLGATRIGHMADWLSELQTNQAKWEIPLEESMYRTAISDFWREYEANSTAHA